MVLKQNTQLDATINRKIFLLLCRTGTAQHVSGITMPIIRIPSVLRTLPPPHSYGKQRLQRQFDGLLMMGIVMPETCWAVSVRQSNKKFLRLIVASSWVFYLSDWRCTEPQTLKKIEWMVFGFEPFRARCTLALGQPICAPCSVTKLEEPCSFSKFPDDPYI